MIPQIFLLPSWLLFLRRESFFVKLVLLTVCWELIWPTNLLRTGVPALWIVSTAAHIYHWSCLEATSAFQNSNRTLLLACVFDLWSTLILKQGIILEVQILFKSTFSSMMELNLCYILHTWWAHNRWCLAISKMLYGWASVTHCFGALLLTVGD